MNIADSKGANDHRQHALEALTESINYLNSIKNEIYHTLSNVTSKTVFDKIPTHLEILKGDVCKIEYDMHKNQYYLDRLLQYPFPFNYGYTTKEISNDGDFKDVVIIGSEFPLSARCNKLPFMTIPLVLMKAEDTGEEDNKVIALTEEFINELILINDDNQEEDKIYKINLIFSRVFCQLLSTLTAFANYKYKRFKILGLELIHESFN